MKRVLLIGGSGQLGTAIQRRWSDCEIAAPPRTELDVAETDRIAAALRGTHADLLVNAAAFHDVDRCETEPLRAFEINAVSVGAAARAARDAGAAFVTFSTDYVFDGAATAAYGEDDAPRPLSVYGTSKLAGEHLAMRAHSRTFVVRTCGLYGAGSRSSRRPFIERVLARRRGDGPVRVVADVVASPTFTGHLADALRRLIDVGAYGLYHAVNTGPVSWLEFAREAARQAGVEVAFEPISAEQWRAAAVRPRFSALSNAKLASLGIPMPSWQAGIAAYLRSAVI